MNTHPATLLIGAAVIFTLAALLFWPGRSILARWLRLARSGRRMWLEDALKHLHDFEYSDRTSTLQSLSGALEISGNHATELASHLQSLGLLTTSGQGLTLTAEGRRYALRIIRTHRLLERFLADRTGLEESDWHREADRREHDLTPTEVARLASRLGHPRFDPHGDPIPTAAGEIPPLRGQPLPDLAPGMPAVVVHVEDEPDAVYQQILAQNIRRGTRVRVIESSPERLHVEADGEEQVLAPLVAANVWVTPQPADHAPVGPHEILHDLRIGEEAAVVGLARTCRGVQRRRLVDLGFCPGARVRAELVAPGGDPTGYRICGAVIALRREQAAQIWIQRQPPGQEPQKGDTP